MVDRFSYKEAVDLRYNGDYSSGKRLYEMALNGLRKQQVVVGRFVGNGKDLSGTKEIKKATLVWRLFILVLLGACGLYICLVGVDHRFVSQGSSFHQITNQGLNSGVCSTFPKLSNADIMEHHPRPKGFNREECACTPVHNFVILSMQRSGSGWFETLLNDHPNISSHGEIFQKRERRENFTTIRETLDAVYNLEWKSSAVKNDCTAAVGHKWMLNQGVMEYNIEVAGYYKKRGVSVILLVRRNVLKRLVSVLANAYDRKMKPLNGTHKSHVHLQEEAKVLAEYRPKISIEHLVENLQRVIEIGEDARHFFNGTRLNLIYYEDLVKDPKSILKVQEFLGVPPRALASKHVKIHTKPLQELIENWEDVLTTLQGTEFESFLDDDDYFEMRV